METCIMAKEEYEGEYKRLYNGIGFALEGFQNAYKKMNQS